MSIHAWIGSAKLIWDEESCCSYCSANHHLFFINTSISANQVGAGASDDHLLILHLLLVIFIRRCQVLFINYDFKTKQPGANIGGQYFYNGAPRLMNFRSLVLGQGWLVWGWLLDIHSTDTDTRITIQCWSSVFCPCYTDRKYLFSCFLIAEHCMSKLTLDLHITPDKVLIISDPPVLTFNIGWLFRLIKH